MAEAKKVKDCRAKPKISAGSERMTKKMRMYQYDPVERFQAYEEEKRKKATKVAKLREDTEMKNCTGRPQISERSKGMFKDLSKMVEWEQRKVEQRQGEVDRVVSSQILPRSVARGTHARDVRCHEAVEPEQGLRTLPQQGWSGQLQGAH